MKKIVFAFTFLIILILASCIPSLHPIATKENRILDDRLVGEWKLEDDYFIGGMFTEDKSSIWKFEQAYNYKAHKTIDKQHSFGMEAKVGALSQIPDSLEIVKKEALSLYFLTYTALGQKYKKYMKVGLTKIAGETYADFSPLGDPISYDRRFDENFVKAHTFAKIEFKDGKLLMYPFKVDKIADLLKQKRARLKHEALGDEEIVLTASTTELRAFIAKYGQKEELFDEAEELLALE